MDLKQLACPRCGLVSSFVAKLLANSTLSSKSSHGHVTDDQPQHAMVQNYPNCPYCSRPLVEFHQLAEQMDGQRKAEEAAKQHERALHQSQPSEIERAQQLGDRNPESERLRHAHDPAHQYDPNRTDANAPEVKRPFETEEARQLHEPHKQVYAEDQTEKV